MNHSVDAWMGWSNRQVQMQCSAHGLMIRTLQYICKVTLDQVLNGSDLYAIAVGRVTLLNNFNFVRANEPGRCMHEQVRAVTKDLQRVRRGLVVDSKGVRSPSNTISFLQKLRSDMGSRVSRNTSEL
jgi:hypothetical protein